MRENWLSVPQFVNMDSRSSDSNFLHHAVCGLGPHMAGVLLVFRMLKLFLLIADVFVRVDGVYFLSMFISLTNI